MVDEVKGKSSVLEKGLFGKSVRAIYNPFEEYAPCVNHHHNLILTNPHIQNVSKDSINHYPLAQSEKINLRKE